MSEIRQPHEERVDHTMETTYASPSPESASSVRWLYLVRGVVAIVWAGTFAIVSDSLTASTATLLVVYPLIDAVASVVDARLDHSRSERTTLWLGAVTSTIAAGALAIAGSGDIADVLRVFGVWATVSGVAQIAVALHRRSPTTGGQWPMLIAGGLSALVGVFYNISATEADPKLDALTTYATAGGVFFVIQAAILAWRLRHTVTAR